ncbi:hypothetical protein JCM10213v2_003157 [Rhodosporidiobolus nylandii]
MSALPSIPLPFIASIGVLGSPDTPLRLRCPAHLHVPFTAVFYSPPGEISAASPYVGTVDLEAHYLSLLDVAPTDSAASIKLPRFPGYQIPVRGQLQLVLKNGQQTAFKPFLIPYDLTDLERDGKGGRTFLRQKSYAVGEDRVQGPLRFAVHLQFCSPPAAKAKKGAPPPEPKFYLYHAIRVVFASRGLDSTDKFRVVLEGPEELVGGAGPREERFGAYAGPGQDWETARKKAKAREKARLASATKGGEQDATATTTLTTGNNAPPAPIPIAFSVAPSRGFGSHFSHLLRASAIAQHYGYELVVLEQGWMYGSLEDVDLIDSHFLSLYTSSPSLTALHATELAAYPPPLPLNGSTTVPLVVQPAFAALEAQANKWWRLGSEVEQAVALAKADIEREMKSGRRPVVGVHVRLGDKCSELHNPLYSPLRFASPDDLARLRPLLGAHCSSKTSTSAPLDPVTLQIYATAIQQAARQVSLERGRDRAQPLVLIMSDDVDVVAQLRGAVEGMDVRGLDEFGRVGKDQPEEGFRVHEFAKLPLTQRITLTKQFLRDLTLLASLSDALVFTGSSNVGRLLAVLGGVEKAAAGRDLSADVRWFPTARYA